MKMLLAQTVGQLDKQVKDEFWKTLFPSGKISEKDVALQTACDLNLQKSPAPVSELAPAPVSAHVSTPASTPSDQVQTRQHRRYNESVKAKLEKRQKKREARAVEEQQEAKKKLEAIRTRAKMEKLEAEKQAQEIPERLKRIIGI